MTNIKSPFYVVPEFISPLQCEELLDGCNFTVPNLDINQKEIKTVIQNDLAESIIFSRLQPLIPELEKYYNLTYKGTERIQFEWYPTTSAGSFICENSEYVRKKWLRVRQRDLTAVLFLSDYQSTTPFDGEFECYGGNLEFPQHQFRFNPTRGTLVVFPSDPHFINITSTVYAGDLFQSRIQIAATVPYLYNPKEFPGNYASWFN